MLRPLGAVLTFFGYAMSLAGLHALAFRWFVPPRPSRRYTSLSFTEAVVYSTIGLLLIGLGVHLLFRRTPTREGLARAAGQRRRKFEEAEQERRDAAAGVWDRTCWQSRYSSQRE